MTTYVGPQYENHQEPNPLVTPPQVTLCKLDIHGFLVSSHGRRPNRPRD